MNENDQAIVRTLQRNTIIHEALKVREFGLSPIDVLSEAVEAVDRDAMVVINRMPEALV